MRKSRQTLLMGVAVTTLLLGARAALAHPGHAQPGTDGLIAGAMHPLSGPDHLLAMLASGLLAVRIGTRKALWMIPCTFVGLMLVGGTSAYLGLALPHAEWGISLSVLVLGLIVALLRRVPLLVGAGIVGLFSVFHGHAHVAEMGGQALMPYLAGFAAMTLVLHAGAIMAGGGLVRAARPQAVRFAGAAIAIAFVVLTAAF